MPRTEKWGDEQVELDAAAAVAETGGAEGVAGESRSLWNFIKRSGKRIAVTIGGFGLVILGLILIPLPGPGWVIVFAGLALLATEFVWAERLLHFAKRRVADATDKVMGNKEQRTWAALVSAVAACIAPIAITANELFPHLAGVVHADLLARVWVSLGTSVVAIVAGHIAIVQIRHASEARQGRWMAYAGLAVGYATVVLVGVRALLAS